MKTITSAIQSKDFTLAGSELAKDQNQKGIKQSVLFSAIGREFQKLDIPAKELIAAINSFADTAREKIDNKQDLSRNLKTYVIRGFNNQAAKDHKGNEPVKVLHFWGEHRKPASFRWDAEPAKTPKTQTASGKNDAPTGDGAPDSSNSKPEKEAELLQRIKLSIRDVELAVAKGSISLQELAKLVDELTADNLARVINAEKVADAA